MGINGRNVLISGAARRLGKAFALVAAHQGANIFLHYNHSRDEAFVTAKEIEKIGVSAWLLKADLEDPVQAAGLVERAANMGPIFAVINSAAIFDKINFEDATFEDWQRTININLTAPFLISQAFARQFMYQGQPGRIINILDWRSLRPGKDHFPYTISKAALAAMTQSMAQALAPRITVNGLALGAILPPPGGVDEDELLKNIPSGRWATIEEASQSLMFLLAGPDYITGEIIHVDGGRHLI